MNQNTIVLNNGTYNIERQFVGAQSLNETICQIISSDEEDQ